MHRSVSFRHFAGPTIPNDNPAPGTHHDCPRLPGLRLLLGSSYFLRASEKPVPPAVSTGLLFLFFLPVLRRQKSFALSHRGKGSLFPRNNFLQTAHHKIPVR